MTHVYYHATADHHDEYTSSYEEAKHLVEEWIVEGDAHPQICKLTTDESFDFINLDEEVIYPENL